MLNIKSVRHLAYRLHTNEDRLIKLADNISNYYSEKTIIRKGKSRNIVVAKKELDNIQKRYFAYYTSMFQLVLPLMDGVHKNLA